MRYNKINRYVYKKFNFIRQVCICRFNLNLEDVTFNIEIGLKNLLELIIKDCVIK